jgi:hypothetical protein
VKILLQLAISLLIIIFLAQCIEEPSTAIVKKNFIGKWRWVEIKQVNYNSSGEKSSEQIDNQPDADYVLREDDSASVFGQTAGKWRLSGDSLIILKGNVFGWQEGTINNFSGNQFDLLETYYDSYNRKTEKYRKFIRE